MLRIRIEPLKTETVEQSADKAVETNRRPAGLLNAGRQLGSSSCAPLSLSAVPIGDPLH
jgi:hypothetical protein